MAKIVAAPGTEILEAALHGLESQRDKLEEQIAHVRSLLGRKAGRPAKHAVSSKGAGTSESATKRILSPEARKRIAAAQKKRWAAFRKTQK